MSYRKSLAQMITGAALLCVLSAPFAESRASDGPAITPAELHQHLAEAKTRALQRQRTPGLRPATVVDVSGYDATYYRIDLRVDEEALLINGVVTMRARAQVGGYTTPTLNLRSELTVDSVVSPGGVASWSHVNSFLYITLDSAYALGEEFEITIGYRGLPPTGGFQGFYFATRLGQPVISTLSEPYLAQSWWPCKDTPSDKADSVDINVTVSPSLYVASNGTLRDSVANPNGTVTYYWHEGYPITTYLVSLAITNYERFTLWYHYGAGNADSMPVRFYSYPDKLSQAQSSWPINVDQLEFFSDVFGEYPFVNEKYGMAHFTWGGGMEHQTVTSATDSWFGFNQYLIAHELAHQWYGDYVTCRKWEHIWMNEGFASYAEALWAEFNGGSSAYTSYMNGMAYYGGGKIYIEDTTSINEIFSTRVYDKGAWVLHMLRGVVGDSVFFAALKAYYDDPAFQYREVVTEEFRDLVESVSGVDLFAFFQDWIYGTYYPKYYWSYLTEQRPGDGLYNVYVHIEQYQTTTPLVFDMPIDLRLNGVAGSPVHTVWNTAREQDFVLVSETAPSSLTFDPGQWILKAAGQVAYGLNLVSESLADGAEYSAYSDTLVAKGGTPPYEFAIETGSLPNGLTLDAATGVIAGIPLVADTADITFRVWDAGHVNTKTKSLTLAIAYTPYTPGDLTGDGIVDAVDLAALIDVVFFGAAYPLPPSAADLNGDCVVDAVDLARMIDAVFFGGAPPVEGCVP